MPYFSASLINRPKLDMDLSSFSAPTNIDMPIPETFNLMASSNETTISSLESSPKILGPPETLKQIED